MGAKRTLGFMAGAVGGLVVGLGGAMALRFWRGRQRASEVWAAGQYPKLKGVGSVETLSILPLVDWRTVEGDLEGEPGVSYLVRAGEKTILFDVGYNMQEEHPSPLLRNMDRLGVDAGQMDAIVISHAHEDHQGGKQHMKQGSFALTGTPLDLSGVPAYVPVPLTHPSADTVVVDGPQVIAPGVATLGIIPCQLFFLGWTVEQSLAVNVAGKGIVLIVGCGHSTLQRIVDRAEMLFDEPVYGMVGGLHYPVTESREKMAGIEMQKVFGTGKWPWDPINESDVEASLAYLKARHPELVALSPHDSCDWSLDAFRGAFGDAYQDVLVGKEIVV